MLAFLDYDGTLTTHECNEVVLQRFVGDAWRPLEAEANADRMSHAEVFDRQIGLIQAPREELLGALVAEAEPEPGLPAFLAELEARGGRAVIVSAGLREAIEAVWSRAQLPPVELHASELVGDGPRGGPPYHLAFSDVLGDCPRCGPRPARGRPCAPCAAPASPCSSSATAPATSAPRAKPTSRSRAATWPSAAPPRASSGGRWPTSRQCGLRWMRGRRDAERGRATLSKGGARADPAAPGFLTRRPSHIMATVFRPRGRRCGAARPAPSRDPGGPWTNVSTEAASSS